MTATTELCRRHLLPSLADIPNDMLGHDHTSYWLDLAVRNANYFSVREVVASVKLPEKQAEVKAKLAQCAAAAMAAMTCLSGGQDIDDMLLNIKYLEDYLLMENNSRSLHFQLGGFVAVQGHAAQAWTELLDDPDGFGDPERVLQIAAHSMLVLGSIEERVAAANEV